MLAINSVVLDFSNINFKIVPKIRKSVACAGRVGFDLIHSYAPKILI